MSIVFFKQVEKRGLLLPFLNCMHPKWEQDFHFSVSSPTSGSLRIKIRDKDKFKDDDISSIEILYSSMSLGQIIDQWYDMIPYKKVKKGGKLHLLLHMAKAAIDEPTPGYPPQPSSYAKDFSI